MKVTRDDPCICGSGKKYKKCCGSNVIDFTEIQSNREKEDFFVTLADFIFSTYYDELCVVLRRFYPDFSGEPEDFMMYDDVDLIFEAFAFDHKRSNGKTPFEIFIKIYARNYRPTTLKWFEKCKDSVFSLYEVVNINEGKEVEVYDLIRKGRYKVRYGEYFDDFVPGDAFFCRLFVEGTGYRTSENIMIISPEIKDELLIDLISLFEKENDIDINAVLKKNTFLILEKVIANVDNFLDSKGLLEPENIKKAKYIYSLTWLHFPNDEFDGLTPIEAYYIPDYRKKLVKMINEPQVEMLYADEAELVKICKEEILAHLGLGKNALKFTGDYQWSNILYKKISQIMEKVLKEKYTPLQMTNGIKMWWDFLQIKHPRIPKPLVWVAVIDYALSNLEQGFKVSQKNLADKYKVAPATIGNKYKELVDVLDIKEFDQRYFSAKIPLEIER